jgi:hypothetical protein
LISVRPWRFAGPRALPPAAGLALGLILLLASAVPALAEPPATEGAAPDYTSPGATWKFNMYHSSLARMQNPDYRACTAASTQSMLNMIAFSYDEEADLQREGTLPRPPLKWQIDMSYGKMERILAYERDNMTMSWAYAGSDPHGWRNALNVYGWGSINAGVYRDSSYPSFDAAARATVLSLARHHRPVGILGWFGRHAQYITGYVVQGEDPRVGDLWSIVGVYVSDPLTGDLMRNAFLSLATWKSGPYYQRFSPYFQSESWVRDPIDGGIGAREWYRKYVIIDAVA